MPMLELILTIGIFAIISVFLLELFLSANALQLKGKEMGKATVMAESIAEDIKGVADFEEGIQKRKFQKCYAKISRTKDGVCGIEDFQSTEKEGTELVYLLSLDENWKETDKKEVYQVVLIPSFLKESEGIMEDYEVCFFRIKGYASLFKKKSDILLYQLEFSKYRKK